MEEVELLCNRVAIIDQGQIIALDTIKNLVAMLGGGVIQIGLHEAGDALVTQLAALPAVKNATRVSTPAPVLETAAPVGALQAEPKPETALVKIEAENSQQAVVNVLAFLNEKDILITSLDILEPNLESVFLHLTGKKLRE